MVEWKEMWQVTTWDKKFSGVDKAMQPKVIKYHYYLANELSELERQNGDIRILYTTDKIAFADSADVDGNISEGEVVAIPWGGNVTIKYYKGKFVTADNRIATSNNTNYLNNKFLYYWMLSQTDLISSFYRGAGIQHPSMYKVLTMSVPIPSLSEQTRIVGILDTFTASIENLKEQIAERRKQYEHYRDQLLDLEGKEGVEMKTLGEICLKITDGSHFSPKSVENGYYMPSVKDMTNNGFDFTTCKQISKDEYENLINTGCKPKINDVLIAKDGSMLKYVFPVTKDEDIVILSSIAILTPQKDIINSAYLSYYLRGEKIKEKTIREFSSKGGVPRIILKNFKKINIIIPSLSEQSRIVSILDTFEVSIANLEAQLKEREKQYEYYRNKLLTFE